MPCAFSLRNCFFWWEWFFSHLYDLIAKIFYHAYLLHTFALSDVMNFLSLLLQYVLYPSIVLYFLKDECNVWLGSLMLIMSGVKKWNLRKFIFKCAKNYILKNFLAWRNLQKVKYTFTGIYREMIFSFPMDLFIRIATSNLIVKYSEKE